MSLKQRAYNASWTEARIAERRIEALLAQEYSSIAEEIVKFSDIETYARAAKVAVERAAEITRRKRPQ